MLNTMPSVREALLELGYPVIVEGFLTKDITYPSITFTIENDVQDSTGDTLGYSNVYYTVKVWANRVSEADQIAISVDEVMRSLGFRRTGTNMVSVDGKANRTLRYRALGLELFN